MSIPKALSLPPFSACMLSHFTHVWLFVTSQTATRQAPLSMGFSLQEYWSRWPFPPPGIKPTSPVLQADSWATRETAAPFSTDIIINAVGRVSLEGHMDSEDVAVFHSIPDLLLALSFISPYFYHVIISPHGFWWFWFFFWKNQKSFKHCLISEVVNQTEYCALGQKQSDD